MTVCDPKIPKSMDPESVIWAFRYGVTMAMYSRKQYLPKRGMSSYVIAPSNVLKLSDRVRRVWLQRHPLVVSS
jgi:hypothetical protein